MAAEAPPTTSQIAEAVLLDPERRRKLFTYASAHFGIDKNDAEDLLQETALELLRYRSYVRSPEGFVFTVFRTRCARFSGARRVDHRVFSESSDLASAPQPESEGLDRQLALREAFAEISSSCRRLLGAYYVEGQSLREAAQTMSLAYSSVAKTLNRCLRKLREYLT
jgi:RNA polymerase sigma factor (sigma-70 family)